MPTLSRRSVLAAALGACVPVVAPARPMVTGPLVTDIVVETGVEYGICVVFDGRVVERWVVEHPPIVSVDVLDGTTSMATLTPPALLRSIAATARPVVLRRPVDISAPGTAEGADCAPGDARSARPANVADVWAYSVGGSTA